MNIKLLIRILKHIKENPHPYGAKEVRFEYLSNDETEHKLIQEYVGFLYRRGYITAIDATTHDRKCYLVKEITPLGEEFLYNQHLTTKVKKFLKELVSIIK